MKNLLFILFALSSFPGWAQLNTPVIKRQAGVAVDALLSNNYDSLIKYTYPKLIEKMGGREKMISILKVGMEELKKQGIIFEGATIGEPSKSVKAGDEIHCLVPQTIKMRVPNGKIISESYLLAISKDNGLNWFFLDTAPMTPENIKEILPNYNSELVLPPKQEPRFVEN